MKPTKKAIEKLAVTLNKIGGETYFKVRGEPRKWPWERASKAQREAHREQAKYILENFVHKKLIPPSGR